MRTDKRTLQAINRTVFFGYLAALLCLSLIKTSSTDLTNDSGSGHLIRLDHLIHFASFLVPAWILLISNRIKIPIFTSTPLAYLIMFSFTLAFISEMVQCLVPYRTFNPKDMIANLLGAGVGAFVYFMGTKEGHTG